MPCCRARRWTISSDTGAVGLIRRLHQAELDCALESLLVFGDEENPAAFGDVTYHAEPVASRVFGGQRRQVGKRRAGINGVAQQIHQPIKPFRRAIGLNPEHAHGYPR